MLVKLKNNWFAPSEKEGYAKGLNLSVSGRRYKKGIHEMPDSLKDFLPPDSEILDKMPEKKVAKELDAELLDLARLDSDRHQQLLEEADATREGYKKKFKKEASK